MDESNLNANNEGVISNAECSPEPESAWAVSLCFWLALMLAAVAYGSVALAPKFSVWDNVRQEYRRNAAQLTSLEADVEYLERVERALATDQEFVKRLAAASSGGSSIETDAELIPVSGNLLFGQGASATPVDLEVRPAPVYQTLVTRLSTSHSLRVTLLAFAAGLTVFAFTFLNDAGAGLVQTAGRGMAAVAGLPVARYSRAIEIPETEEASEDAETV